jgi:hypothetical protein
VAAAAAAGHAWATERGALEATHRSLAADLAHLGSTLEGVLAVLAAVLPLPPALPQALCSREARDVSDALGAMRQVRV